MTDHFFTSNCATSSLYEMIPEEELDVSSLQGDADATDNEEEEEEADPRVTELNTIEAFVKARKNCKALPVVEKKEQPVAPKRSFNFGQGRPRKSFFSEITFIKISSTQLKRAGRGRPGKEERVKFKVHHCWATRLSYEAVYELEHVKNMQLPPNAKTS